MFCGQGALARGLLEDVCDEGVWQLAVGAFCCRVLVCVAGEFDHELPLVLWVSVAGLLLLKDVGAGATRNLGAVLIGIHAAALTPNYFCYLGYLQAYFVT